MLWASVTGSLSRTLWLPLAKPNRTSEATGPMMQFEAAESREPGEAESTRPAQGPGLQPPRCSRSPEVPWVLPWWHFAQFPWTRRPGRLARPSTDRWVPYFPVSAFPRQSRT